MNRREQKTIEQARNNMTPRSAAAVLNLHNFGQRTWRTNKNGGVTGSDRQRNPVTYDQHEALRLAFGFLFWTSDGQEITWKLGPGEWRID